MTIRSDATIAVLPSSQIAEMQTVIAVPHEQSYTERPKEPLIYLSKCYATLKNYNKYL